MPFKMTKFVAALAVVGGAGLFAGAAQADGIGLHYGYNQDYQRLTLQYETAPLWSSGEFWGTHIDLTGELGVSYWWADSKYTHKTDWQFNAIPMWRWWLTDIFYVEAGVGATALTDTWFANKRLSTAFQFGDHIGAGFLLDKNNRVGLRISHFSNASIKAPNPGLDTVQVTYTYLF